MWYEGGSMSNSEQEKIEATIRSLKDLQSRGLMSGDLADASIAALNAQLDNLKQAEPEKPAFQIGGNVAGSVISGNNNTIVAPLPEGASPQELRAAYLNHLLENVSQVQLSGIDPKTASDAEARLNLGAVYTALLTLSSEDHKALQKGKRADLERLMERNANTRRASALEQLNRHARFVLLGDPGSGKSTFVNFVAMCLAGEALGNKDANLAALTAPLPLDEDERPQLKKEEKPAPQPWDHGALLPMRVILRDFAARGLPPLGAQASAKTLWDFIIGELDGWALSEFQKPLAQELLQKGGLLLLDGLDEVPDANQRRAQIKQAIEGFAASFPKCRILVTSRTYAYQKQDWRLNNFSESLLAPFSKGQIHSFVERWYAHIGLLRRMDADDAKGRAELLKRAIANSDRLLGLAERPLLLTLMASLHAWRGGSLPEKREELYADAVDLLLDWWESPKTVRDARGELVIRQPSLAEWLKVDRQKVRVLLEELAFKAHAAQTELTGTADISEADLVSGLMRLSQNPDVNPRQLVDYLSLRAGLLIPRGVGIFTFPHRTFQEYLAACHLTDHDYPDKVAELACADFNRWREVALLAGAKAARGTSSAIWSLVDALCFNEPGADPSEKGQWGAHLAGQALLESGSLNIVSQRNLPKQTRVQSWLVTILQSGKLPAIERARAGDTLAALGDPRFDPERWFLPREPTIGFIHIPAGKFIMGSDEKDRMAQDREKPQHELDLSEYWIARYPVTVAQYRAFVETSGHRTTDAESLRGTSNHPVVNVTWYDALAYCEWLTKQLSVLNQYQQADPFWQGLASGKLRVSLPSEAEWEKAARGTDGRQYPWGKDADSNLANYDETGIGGTSPVGTFPGGASPYGVLDMSGNVWEWTRSLWGTDWNKSDFKYPYQPGMEYEDLNAPREILRVLRGGAFYSQSDDARCAFRYWFDPLNWLSNLGFRVMVGSVFSRASL